MVLLVCEVSVSQSFIIWLSYHLLYSYKLSQEVLSCWYEQEGVLFFKKYFWYFFVGNGWVVIFDQIIKKYRYLGMMTGTFRVPP